MFIMKKIFAIGALLIAICMVGAVCAVSVNTPEGFTLNKDLSKINQTGEFKGVEAQLTQYVMENGTHNITVTDIQPLKSIDLSAEGKTVEKNISGKQGLFEEKNGVYMFLYKDGDNLIQIEAPNEKLIEQVIGK